MWDYFVDSKICSLGALCHFCTSFNLSESSENGGMKLNRPTKLLPSEIAEFKRLYHGVTGITLSDAEAEKQGLALTNVIAILLELDDQD